MVNAPEEDPILGKKRPGPANRTGCASGTAPDSLHYYKVMIPLRMAYLIRSALRCISSFDIKLVR